MTEAPVGERSGGLLTATEFEFRNRFWLIGLVIWLGFSLSVFDHVNVVQFVAERLSGADTALADTIMRAMFGVGALLVLMAASLRTWATAYLRADVMQDSAVHAEAIVADGPYRHTRNPLYLGNLLLATGFGALASRSGFPVIVLGMLFFCLRLIGLEESRLLAEQGERYREYVRRVPRLFPSLTPRVPASERQPRWGQAFLGEGFIWAFFLGIAVFAITLRVNLLWICVGGGLVAYVALSYALKPKRK